MPEDGEKRPFKGLTGFFGLIWRNKGALVKINLLFWCFSLLMVTAAPAFVAMMALLAQLVRGWRPAEIATAYWNSFAANLGRSLLWGLGWALVLAGNVALLRACWAALQGGRWWAAPLLFCAAALLLLLAAGGLSLALLLPAVDMPFRRLVWLALGLPLRHPVAGLGCPALLAGLIALILRLGVAGLLLCLLFGFALLGLVAAWCFVPHLPAPPPADRRESAP